MKNAILLIICVLSAASLSTAEPNIAAAKEEIGAILDQQVEAWNRGDLEAFMETYWKSENLTYFSGGTPRNGWQATLDRYVRTYQSEKSEMGFLEFKSIDVEILGPDSAFVRGQWHLERKKLEDIGGLFTLVLKEFPEGWKIIHDHSSSSE